MVQLLHPALPAKWNNNYFEKNTKNMNLLQMLNPKKVVAAVEYKWPFLDKGLISILGKYRT